MRKRAVSSLILASLLAALLAVLLAACSDEARRPTEDSLLATEAIGVIDSARKAYVSKNFSGIASYCSDEAYDAITKSLKAFASVELEFSPRWMEIGRDGHAVMTRVSWSGKWEPTGGGTPVEREGTAVFRLEGKPLRIIGIDRQSPFAQP